MQALSAEIRYSCGLANRFEPPSSQGSSISIEDRRVTTLSPSPNPSTSDRLRVWPCQVVATRQWVLPSAGSFPTRSNNPNRSSRLIPLTIFGATVLVYPSMIDLLVNGDGKDWQRYCRLVSALWMR